MFCSALSLSLSLSLSHVSDSASKLLREKAREDHDAISTACGEKKEKGGDPLAECRMGRHGPTSMCETGPGSDVESCQGGVGPNARSQG